MNELGLGLVFSAKDLASGVMQRVSKGMLDVQGRSSEAGKAIQGHFQSFSTGMATLGAGASLLGGAFGLAGVSGKFNEQVASVGAVANASAEELKALHDAAIDAGVATQFSPTEAIVGLGDLAQAGYSAQESIDLLRPVLDLAAGSLGQLSPSGAAGLASQTMKAFKIPISEAGITMDKLLQSVNAFALSANELPLALGTAARGAGVMNQSLDETLIALGLVKNVVPGVERASTAVAVAMERMVNPDTATALKAQGVAVADAKGRFRPFLDVIQDLIPALNKMGTEQKRAAFLSKTFGTEALGGIQAILGQVTNGIRDNTGATLTGAAAIEYLRNTFKDAGGTAGEFASEMLDTFEGQKKLMTGSIETLSIVLGEPFERALKPVVAFALELLNGLLSFVKSIPDGVKDFIAKLVLVAGTVLTVVGGFIAAKAAIAMFMYGMSAIGVTVGGLLSTLLPALAVIAAIAGAFYALKYAADNDIGYFGTKVAYVFRQVEIWYTALGQLFSEGGLEGDIAQMFLTGDNAAVNFAVKLYVVANRIVSFFEGVWSGVSTVLAQAQPSFDAFMAAVNQLGTAFGGLGGKIDTFANQTALDDAGQAGQSTGLALGKVLVALVNILTVGIETLAGFTGKMNDMAAAVSPVKDAVSQIVDELKLVGEALGLTDNAVDGSAGGWQEFGATIGAVIAAVLGALRGLVSIGGGMFVGFANIAKGVIDILHGLFTLDLMMIFKGMLRIIYGAMRAASAPIFGLVEAVAGVIDAIRGEGSHLADSVAGVRKDLMSTIATGLEVQAYDWNKPKPKPVPVAPGETMPQEVRDFYTMPEPGSTAAENAGTAAAAAQAESQADFAPTVENLEAAVADMKATKAGAPTFTATMTVDGQVLGEVVATAQSSSNAQGGGTTPVTVQ